MKKNKVRPKAVVKAPRRTARPAERSSSMLPVAQGAHFFAAFQRMLDFFQKPGPETRKAFYGMLLEQALGAVACPEGSLLLLVEGGQSEQLKLVSIKGIFSEVWAGDALDIGQGLCGRVAASRKAVLDKEDGRVVLAIPLEYGKDLVGVLCLYRAAGGGFSATDLDRSKGLARGLGAVLTASRALAQREEALFKLSALTEAGTVINSNRDLPGLLASIMTEAEKVMKAEASSVFLIDEEKNELYFELATGPRGEAVQQIRLKVGEGIAGWVAKEGKPLLVPDADSDPRFARRVDEKSKFKTRNILCVPLKIGSRILGVVQVLNRRGDETFKTSDVSFFEALASMAAVAIENATLYLSLEKRAEQLNRDLIDANQELAIAKNRIESILFNMEDGVIATDKNDKVLFLNRRAENLAQAGRNASTGQAGALLMELPKVREALGIVKGDGKSLSFEVPIATPAGARTYAAVLTPIYDLVGDFTGTVSVLRDITDLKELDRLKTEFLNTVSHELRTPMTSIRAFSELMAKKEAKPDKVRQWSGIINQETERLGRLIDDLLDVSRIEAGKKMRIEKQPVPLEFLAGRSLELFRNVSEKHPFTAELEGGLENVSAPLDRDRIIQVVGNLVTNAIKYSPQGGPVAMRILKAQPGWFRVEVRDQGIGLTDKDRAHLFEKFYRADSAATQHIGGTGLGLAIVKHIVETHGGKVGVESELCRGSSFWFELPLAGDEA